MGVYTHSDESWLSRRGVFLVALIIFHIGLLWALKSGFAVRLLESISPPIVANIINEMQEEEPPPPAPPIKMEVPPIDVPAVELNIQLPVDSPITSNSLSDRPVLLQPPPRQVVRTVLRVNPRAPQPNIFDYYPDAARAAAQEGRVTVRVCVGADGRVLRAELDQTSGFPLLDEAGVKVAKLLTFTPPTEDGKSMANACGPVPVNFKAPKK